MATSTSPPPAPAIDSPPAQTHLPHLPHPSDSGGPLDDYNMNSKIIISALCILFLIVLTIVILHVYAKWCSSRRAHVQQRMVAYLRSTGSLSVAPSESAKSCGLEKEIVNGLPTFAYLPPVSKRTADSLGAASVAKAAECAVCLAEFRQGEACKMIPKCKHFFHVRCIDIWLLSNTTCPLCRATPGLSIVDEEAAEHSTGGDCDELCQGSQRGLVLGQDMEMGMAKDGQDDHNLLNSGFSSQSRRWKRSLSDKILGAVSAKELVIPSNHAQMRPRPPLVWGRSASYSTIDSLRDVESQVEFSTRSCRSGLVSPRAASRPLDDP